MSGSAFERCMQELARNKKDNGGTTTDDLLSAIIAANDDRREATADTDKRLLNLTERFEVHIADRPIQTVTDSILNHEKASAADRRELAVELAAYKAQIKAAVDAVAVELTEYRSGGGRAARRRDDPPEVNYAAKEDEQLGDMRRFWRVGRWAVMVACVALLSFGLSYWADACSRTNYWGAEPPITATPAPTQAQ